MTDFNISVPPQVQAVVERLNDRGFSAYAVGGCVRDSLLGTEPKDWDITTSATACETKNAFPDYAVIETGIEHGTVSVIIEGKPYEVTTFRTEGGYSDNRHPDFVEFVSDVKEDLSRRDFTVNAMAYDCKNNRLIDLFGGARDIENRVIRCVGNPELRFKEDGLRILRGLRFAAVLGFSVEPETALAMKRCKGLLKNISAERVFSELKQALCGREAESVLREFREVFAEIIPELKPMFDFPQNNPYHCYDVWEHTLHSLSAVPEEANLRFTMLFHDMGKPQTHSAERKDNGEIIDHFYSHEKISEQSAREVLARLKSDKELRHTVALLVKNHGIDIQPSRRIIKRRLNKFGEEILRKLITVKRADAAAQSLLCRRERLKQLDEVEGLLNEIIAEDECFSIKNLAIDGNDVIALGFSGRDVGVILNKTVDEVINENLKNEKYEIIKYIISNF